MKAFASVRVLLVAIPGLLVLQLASWVFFSDTLALFVTSLLVQLSLGVFVLWLAYRIQRSQSTRELKWQQSNSRQEALSKNSVKMLGELSQIVELNTRAIREVSQLSATSEAHPRDLRALDDISVIRREVENLRHAVAAIESNQISSHRRTPEKE